MSLPPLIDVCALQSMLAADEPLLLCDCGHDLADPAAGARAHQAGHLPGALHLHLDADLSAPTTGRNGRHPLPTPDQFAVRLSALGFADDLPVVVYDSSGGMYAARLWWMLRWLGHAQVQVLDGGLPAWRKAGGDMQAGAVAPRAPGNFTQRASLERSLDFEDLLVGLGKGKRLIVDARGPDRFRGENETLDPVGGHIPGALNRCFRDNLAAEGGFKPAAQLRAEWLALMGQRQAADLVQQCGSGVTACLNLLAMASAGLEGSALYPGSWSEWCAQPQAPVAVGD